MGLHDRLSKQNENGAASVTAERPVALARPRYHPRRAECAGGHAPRAATRTPS